MANGFPNEEKTLGDVGTLGNGKNGIIIYHIQRFGT
jgi:hypothetical protein